MSGAPEITHAEICAIADEVSQCDFEACVNDRGFVHAQARRAALRFGAIRMSAWLKKHGYKIVKETDHG